MFGIVWLLRVFLPLNISMYNYSYLPPTKRINTSHSTVMASFYRYFVGVTDLLAGSVQESSHREHVALHQVPFLQPGLIFVLFADIPPPLLLLLLFYIIYYFLFFSNFIYSFIYILFIFISIFRYFLLSLPLESYFDFFPYCGNSTINCTLFTED